MNMSTRTYTQKACIHLVRNLKWKKGACRANGYVSLTTSATLSSCHSVLTNELWSFPALFVFFLFLLSHTFVDVLSCLGQMYVRHQPSGWSCLHQFSTAGQLLFSFSHHCRPVFGFFVCLVSIYPLLINVMSSLHLKLCSFLTH